MCEFVPPASWLLLFFLAYNLGNFLRRLAPPKGLRHWSLKSLDSITGKGSHNFLRQKRTWEVARSG
ncbi:MAG: hypothetical protein ACE5JS_00140 [Nitrospinota bacterium]